MDRAPLPPHERPWRHPSELGPPAHEPTSTSGRVIIATAATFSLLLIGLLIVTMTPDQGEQPQAVASTASDVRTTAAAIAPARLPLVTPIGDEGWAVTTTGAVKARAGLMSARLPNGDVVDVEIVQRDEDSGITVVSLPGQTAGYELAESQPEPDELVAVHGAQDTHHVELTTLSTMDVDEGAPVLDDHGDLVGLCTKTAGGTSIVPVSTMPGAATTTVPQPSTTGGVTVATTTPTTSGPTTAPPTTARPSTSTTAPTPTTTPVPVTSVGGGATDGSS